MDIDYGAWKFWHEVIRDFGTLLIGIYVWISNRNRVTQNSLESHAKRLTSLETDLKLLPNREQLEAISDKLEASNKELNKLIGRFEGVNRLADIMNIHLINKGTGQGG